MTTTIPQQTSVPTQPGCIPTNGWQGTPWNFGYQAPFGTPGAKAQTPSPIGQAFQNVPTGFNPYGFVPQSFGTVPGSAIPQNLTQTSGMAGSVFGAPGATPGFPTPTFNQFSSTNFAPFAGFNPSWSPTGFSNQFGFGGPNGFNGQFGFGGPNGFNGQSGFGGPSGFNNQFGFGGFGGFNNPFGGNGSFGPDFTSTVTSNMPHSWHPGSSFGFNPCFGMGHPAGSFVGSPWSGGHGFGSFGGSFNHQGNTGWNATPWSGFNSTNGFNPSFGFNPSAGFNPGWGQSPSFGPGNTPGFNYGNNFGNSFGNSFGNNFGTNPGYFGGGFSDPMGLVNPGFFNSGFYPGFSSMAGFPGFFNGQHFGGGIPMPTPGDNGKMGGMNINTQAA